MNLTRIFTKMILSLAVVSLVVGYSSEASAGGNAVVNLNKIRENYNTAQELTAELQIKEAELQRFIEESQRKIQKAKTPVEKKNLKEKLGQQFVVKRNAYAKDQSEKWNKVETDVINTIKAIAKSKKYAMVFSKQTVIVGGKDITEDVIKALNKKQ